MGWTGLLVVLACLGLGLGMRLGAGLPPGAHRPLNLFVLWVPLPALILAKLPALLQDPAILARAWVPISMPWLHFALALAIAKPLARLLGLGRRQEGALALTMALGNTSFVGFPLLQAWMGPEALPIGILVDQPGSFLILSTLGVIVAGAYAGERVPLGQVMWRAGRFPPMHAFALSALLACAPWPLPSALQGALEAMAASLVPVALVAVGMQLVIPLAKLRSHLASLAAGLSVKLLLMPALFAGLYLHLLGLGDRMAQVTVAEAAMAPMITSAILAEEAGLDGELAGLMVVLGILLSLLTVPLWMGVLGFLPGG